MKQLLLILICVAVCTTYAAADLLEGLVLYMPLDEGDGKTTFVASLYLKLSDHLILWNNTNPF